VRPVFRQWRRRHTHGTGWGAPESELYRGVRLARALEWRAAGAPTLSEAEAQFLDASQATARAEQVAAEEQVRMSDLYSLMVYGYLITTVNEALAVAPRLQQVRIVAIRARSDSNGPSTRRPCLRRGWTEAH